MLSASFNLMEFIKCHLRLIRLPNFNFIYRKLLNPSCVLSDVSYHSEIFSVLIDFQSFSLISSALWMGDFGWFEALFLLSVDYWIIWLSDSQDILSSFSRCDIWPGLPLRECCSDSILFTFMYTHDLI